MNRQQLHTTWGFPGGAMVKNPSANAGDARDASLIPGLGRSPGGGNDNPPQYSCMKNSMDKVVWRATVHGVAKSHMWLSTKRTYRWDSGNQYWTKTTNCLSIKTEENNHSLHNHALHNHNHALHNKQKENYSTNTNSRMDKVYLLIQWNTMSNENEWSSIYM